MYFASKTKYAHDSGSHFYSSLLVSWLNLFSGTRSQISFELAVPYVVWQPFKRQPHKMVKQTQKIRRRIVWVGLTISQGWRLKG